MINDRIKPGLATVPKRDSWGRRWGALAAILGLGLILAGLPMDRSLSPRASAAEGAAPAGVPVAKAENPHWRAAGCPVCHAGLKGDELPTSPPPDIQALCLSCHDGKRATGEPHPVSVPPTHTVITRPAIFPLVDGRLACQTCHNHLLACNRRLIRPAYNRAFLRGLPPQPTQTAEAFCMNCHSPDQYKKVNPHIMLEAAPALGEPAIRQSRCLICHTKVLDRATRLRTGQSFLRGPKIELCLGCHQVHSDMKPNGHLGTAITPEVAEYIKARNVGILYAHLKEVATQPAEGPNSETLPSGRGRGEGTAVGSVPVRAAGQAPHGATTNGPKAPPATRPESSANPAPPADFPFALDPAGKIVCATCHNPHQQQTFPADSILSYGAMRLAGAGRVTSSVPSQELCQDCHDLSKLVTGAGGTGGRRAGPTAPSTAPASPVKPGGP